MPDEKISLMKEFFGLLIKEGEKRFDERLNSIEKLINNNSLEAKEAVKAALDAQEKATTVALTATKEANVKAEISADKRFDSLNSNFMESLSVIRIDLASLRESRSEMHGTAKAQYRTNEQSNWITGVVIASLLSAAAILISIINVFKL